MRSSANTAPNEEQDSLHVHPSITYSLILKGVIVNNFHFLHIKNNVENYVEMLKNYSFSQVDYIAGKKNALEIYLLVWNLSLYMDWPHVSHFIYLPPKPLHFFINYHGEKLHVYRVITWFSSS